MTMTIPLTRGRVAIVDDEDYEWLSAFNWQAVVTATNAYAIRATPSPNPRMVFMHRLILDVPKGIETDHINRDGLDNRRANLRLATRAQNNQNRQGKPGVTGVHGVTWYAPKGTFRARVWRNHKQLWVRYFHRLEDAEAAVKEARAHFYTHAPECGK